MSTKFFFVKLSESDLSKTSIFFFSANWRMALAAFSVLAETPQQVCSKMMEITGMNFRNFTRSILLAQGDFAAFLNALDAERMLPRIASCIGL